MELTREEFMHNFEDVLERLYSKPLEESSNGEKYMALAMVIRDYYSRIWTEDKGYKVNSHKKEVYYFSIEFMPGRLLKSNLLNLGILSTVREALRPEGIELETLIEEEQDMAIGNGGLGRLASCFMDSLASCGFPGHGNGIRYKYGLFKQKIIDGHQVELPDTWLTNGNPWEVIKSDQAVEVKFGGSIWLEDTGKGYQEVRAENQEVILAVPYDTAMVGYENSTVNNMRLWRAELPRDISRPNLSLTYMQEVEMLSSILYPDDSNEAGRLLRLKQEYFFVSAGLQSILAYFLKNNSETSLTQISNYIAVHINDTHPALSIPEFMRILMDEHGLGWDIAWEMTVQVMSYTNHTIMAEAMETWPEAMVEQLLPRIYQIILEIDRRFEEEYLPKAGPSLVQRTHIVQEGLINMAHLAVIGSHSTNGVAKLHTELLEEVVLHDFYQIFPERFNNKTNGIADRRWLQLANENLSTLLDQKIGTQWRTDLNDLKKLEAYQDDPEVLSQLAAIKRANKQNLADLIKEKNGVEVSPDAIFDVQVKRLHAYKRQVLNLLHILKLYYDLKDNPDADILPRVFIFGAKAAPSYWYAKSVIKAINEVANMINQDVTIKGKLKVIFLENYNVSLAEEIVPAADVGEQISLASKEASGTSNMKLMLNGALTMATLDGANIEIKEAVGDDNIFIFGLTKDQVYDYYENRSYSSRQIYEESPTLKRILDSLETIPNMENEGREIFDSLITYNDEYFVLRDFDDYIRAQKDLEARYRDQTAWNRSSLLNIANAGRFSADRTVQEYAADIWGVVVKSD